MHLPGIDSSATRAVWRAGRVGNKYVRPAAAAAAARVLGDRRWHRVVTNAAVVAGGAAADGEAAEAGDVDVLVLGGGAAGLAAAHFAAAGGSSVVVLEKNSKAGRKILISGGRRCNVLPASVDVQRDYFSESSRSAVRAAFSTWSLDECQAWLADGRQGLGLQLSLEEETGKFFPSSNSSAEVRDRLLAACARHGVGLRYGAAVVGLHQQQQQEEGEKGSGGEARGGWRCVLQDGSQLAARRVILATGGKSYPTLGTTGDGWRLLEQLGHTLHAPYPALTPLLGTHPGQAQLAGISLYSAQVSVSSAATGAGGNGSGSPRQGSGRGAKARQLQQAERSDLLFTHRGWSGPAILDVSHHMAMAMDRGQPLPAVSVRWTHDDATAWDRHLAAGSGGAALVPHVLRRHGLPHRLAEALVVEVGLPPDRKVAELRRGERQALLEALAGWLLPVSSHGGFAKAEVTGGGLPLEQVNCRTLESRLRPGLHIVGELLDVTGRVGGFNFFWAFLTGRAAGLAAAAVPAERG